MLCKLPWIWDTTSSLTSLNFIRSHSPAPSTSHINGYSYIPHETGVASSTQLGNSPIIIRQPIHTHLAPLTPRRRRRPKHILWLNPPLNLHRTLIIAPIK